tara:strand:+ start:1164 stop:1580 length:417 start_codon:yes stop_codon:yes gene_type:complete
LEFQAPWIIIVTGLSHRLANNVSRPMTGKTSPVAVFTAASELAMLRFSKCRKIVDRTAAFILKMRCDNVSLSGEVQEFPGVRKMNSDRANPSAYLCLIAAGNRAKQSRGLKDMGVCGVMMPCHPESFFILFSTLTSTF